MKKTLAILSFVLAFALAGTDLQLQAQTILTQTTLSAAVTTTSTTFVSVASATGITANSTVLYLADSGSGELMFVNSVNGTTIGVTRGSNGGPVASTHASGALVFVAPPNAVTSQPPSGSCTRANQPYLPLIAMGVGGNEPVISDCVGGIWVNASGLNSAATFFRVPQPACGDAGYSTCGTNTAIAAATSMYCTEIDVVLSKNLTGLAVLNGATVGTDKHLVILYDGSGNLLANSATAGATTSGANSYQTYAFTTKYYLVGPAVYYACLQSNGTTDTVQMLATANNNTYTTKAVTGQTFGTIAATFTVPTTFTTVVGPHWALY